MNRWVTGYLYFEVSLVLVALIATAWVSLRRRKVRTGRPPVGYESTSETFIDPTTGLVFRVWYHPGTGERFYERIDTPKR